MAWSKNGTPDTLTSSGTTIEVTDVAGTAFNLFLTHHLNTGGTAKPAWSMNDDATSQHAERWSLNGGAETTTTSVNFFDPAGAPSEDWFIMGYFVDISGEEKLFITSWCRAGAAGAGTAPQRFEHVGKFTGGTITKFEGIIGGTGSADTDSNLSLLGTD
jgi:hypothetical protein